MSKTILVPIDLEHKSSWSKALPTAADQARVLDAKVWVMTVVPHIVGGLDWRYAIRGAEHGSLEFDDSREVRFQVRPPLDVHRG